LEVKIQFVGSFSIAQALLLMSKTAPGSIKSVLEAGGSRLRKLVAPNSDAYALAFCIGLCDVYAEATGKGIKLSSSTY